jgi:esterase/lipase superfamily enzyme
MATETPWNPIKLWAHHKAATVGGALITALAIAASLDLILEGSTVIAGIAVLLSIAWGVIAAHLMASSRRAEAVLLMIVLVLAGLVILSGPVRPKIYGTPAHDIPDIVGRIGDRNGDETLTQVTVFYATDRSRSPGDTVQYEATRNATETLALGHIVVGVPKDHRLGNIERPSIWTLYREDPEKHFIVLDGEQLTYETFYERIRMRVGESAVKQAFVFVHGFNVTFMDAVYRTAQMAYDLSFDGAPILYSWPSAASLTPIGYTTDVGNSYWTVEHLRWFLEDVAAKSGAQRIHLIAHSMGNKALVDTLNRMPRLRKKRFSQIMLTAPDIDAATFIQLAGAIKDHGQMTTLYTSANDAALLASKKLQAYRRAGDTRGGVVIVPGIETVDVSAVDTNFVGHFYYGDNRSVLSDMFLILTQSLPASKRPTLRPEGKPPEQFWRFAQ